MSGAQPVAVYALRIPPGDVMVPAVPLYSAAGFRLTMAAIDPSEEPDLDATDEKQKPRATLKVVRVPDGMLDDDDEDEDDLDDDDEEEDDDDEDDSEAEQVNGGPSKKPSKNALGGDDEDEDDDEEEDAAAEALLAKIMRSDKKGKNKAIDGDDEDDEDDDDESVESIGMDECVLCTLDLEKQCQQPLDFSVAEGENVFFKVSGNMTIHLTGNYVMPYDEPSDDEDEDEDEDDYDDEELDGLEALLAGEESDELDDLEDPRIMEVDEEEEKQPKRKAISAAVGKGKNKRPADDEDEDVSLDNIMAKSLKEDEAATSADSKKLSKAEKKAAKKLKNNEGQATTPPADAKKDAPQTNGDSGKKVQFAKNLEQGPTPSKSDPKSVSKTEDKKASTSLGIKDVQGVSVDDRKIGSGPAAKKGSRLEMRYIGKLDSNNKVFDSNKSGKPFSFKLGVGEVIKGWDIGLAGISAGGERRLVIPAHLAYGKKALPGIPANSKLIFDIKCLSVK